MAGWHSDGGTGWEPCERGLKAWCSLLLKSKTYSLHQYPFMTNILSTMNTVNSWLAILYFILLGPSQATFYYDKRCWVAPPLTPPTTRIVV